MTPLLAIVRDKRFFNGPTIPYLIGAMRHHKRIVAPLQDVRRELIDIVKALQEETQFLEIRWCPEIKAHIVKSQVSTPDKCAHALSSESGKPAVYYRDIGAHDFDSLVEALAALYGQPILADTLSRDQAGWKKIDASEGREIDLTISNPELRSRSVV
jgi:hypothetical protein